MERREEWIFLPLIGHAVGDGLPDVPLVSGYRGVKDAAPYESISFILKQIPDLSQQLFLVAGFGGSWLLGGCFRLFLFAQIG